MLSRTGINIVRFDKIQGRLNMREMEVDEICSPIWKGRLYISNHSPMERSCVQVDNIQS